MTALLLLSGCGGGGDGSPAVAFRPPSYDYLTKLRLNVGDVRIENQVTPAVGPSDLSARAPTPPVQAMRTMAADRLVAAGTTGTAVFTIDQAAITGRPGGTLDGTLAAHLDIIGPSGGHNGYAEAHVSRQFVPGTGGDDGLKAQLYALTTRMMGDMNVELEYQVRRTLGDWLVDASGAPVGATVEQQSLAPAGTTGGAATGSAAPGALPAALPPLNGSGALLSVPVPSTATPAASSSVGAPTELAPPPGTAPVGVPVQGDATAAGPIPLAPAAQTPSSIQPSGQPSPTPGAIATPATTPPPGFMRLPNGYLAPVGRAQPLPSSQVSGPLNLAPAASATLPPAAAQSATGGY